MSKKLCNFTPYQMTKTIMEQIAECHPKWRLKFKRMMLYSLEVINKDGIISDIVSIKELKENF